MYGRLTLKRQITARLRPRSGRASEHGGGWHGGSEQASSAWKRYAWIAGILYVIALVAETVVGLLGGSVSQNDSAAKIANVLYDHRERLLVITYLSVVYAAMFLIYLGRLYDLLRGNTDRSRFLGSLVLAGGALFIALHAVSDIGINGLLGAKLASFGFQHDQGMSYTLYLMTYGLDSVGDVFGSIFAFAAGVLVIEHGVLPRWLGWVSILVGIFLPPGLRPRRRHRLVRARSRPHRGRAVPDLVLVSSVILLTRENTLPDTAGGIRPKSLQTRRLQREWRRNIQGSQPNWPSARVVRCFAL